jgi:hypothetical protein
MGETMLMVDVDPMVLTFVGAKYQLGRNSSFFVFAKKNP